MAMNQIQQVEVPAKSSILYIFYRSHVHFATTCLEWI